MKVRPCAYAGSFYPAEPNSLLRILEHLFSLCDEYNKSQALLYAKGDECPPHLSTEIAGKVYGIISPHAGYIYSGLIAAIGFCTLGKKGNISDPEFTGTIIIIAPGHKTPYSSVSVCEWETPLGNIKTDEQLANAISEQSGISINEQVHLHEHGIEVILPFIKYRFPNAHIIAIQLGNQRLEPSIALGESIASCITDAGKKLGEDVYVIASSDGSHYIPHNEAKKCDIYTLATLSNLDCCEFYEQAKYTTMCGYGPTIAMVTAAKACGAEQGVCLAYATSGDVTGDHTQVVGYATLAVI